MGLKDTLIHIGGVLGLATYGDDPQGYQQQHQPMDGYMPMQEPPSQDGYYPQDGQPYQQQPNPQYQQPQQGGYGQPPRQQHAQQPMQKGGGFQQGYQPPKQSRGGNRQQTQAYPPPQQDPYQGQEQGYGGDPMAYGNTAAQPRPRPQEQAPPQQQQKRQPHQILIVHVRNVEDAQQYIQALLGGYTVLLNLDGADQHVAQRVIDQLTGATFALGGTLAPVTPYVFVLTSSDTKITDNDRARMRRDYPPPQQHRR